MCNKKGLLIIGFIISIFLGFGVINSFSSDSGCAGDCMSCHPKLKGDNEHKILYSCIDCHAPKANNLSVINSVHSDGCGGNCFECHDTWPQDGNHAELFKCKSCHE